MPPRPGGFRFGESGELARHVAPVADRLGIARRPSATALLKSGQRLGPAAQRLARQAAIVEHGGQVDGIAA